MSRSRPARRKTPARGRPDAGAGLPRLFVTPGEPAGIGPDVTLLAARRELPAELVAVADPALLRERARRLGVRIALEPFDPRARRAPHRPGRLPVAAVPLRVPVRAGTPDRANAGSVLESLRHAVALCERAPRAGLVTGPVHKGVINEGGIAFTGHTEFLAGLTGVATPVMMLVAGTLRVALVTTHLPLREVADAVTASLVKAVARVLVADLRRRFGIARPRVLVAGLNPHAGEGGHLGSEEREILEPALSELRAEGLDLRGPLPADTLFTPRLLDGADAVLAMYHDQGLPVLKHAGFGAAVNVTLGLPIVRTSVDHGTALELAGTGRADPGSLLAAIDMAAELARRG